MSSLGERLLVARKAKGWTQIELARKAGVSQATISDIERGRNNTSIEATSIARALGLSIDSLLTGKNFNAEEFPRTASNDDFAFIPYYNAQGSCGNGCTNDHIEIKKNIAFHKGWLKENWLFERHLSVISAKGDSMSPTINDGSVLLVNSQYERIESGRVYALAFNDEVRIKRIFINFNGDWRVVSDNTNKTLYPDETVSLADADKINVIGMVVWSGGKI